MSYAVSIQFMRDGSLCVLWDLPSGKKAPFGSDSAGRKLEIENLHTYLIEISNFDQTTWPRLQADLQAHNTHFTELNPTPSFEKELKLRDSTRQSLDRISHAKMVLLLFALIWLCNVPECRALKSEGLVSYCQVAKKTVMTDAEMIQFQFCNGYIQGLSDAMQMRQDEIDAKGRLTHTQTFCLPDEVTTTELALVYLKYMDGHPEKLHDYAFVTLWNALSDAYRCPRDAPQP